MLLPPFLPLQNLINLWVGLLKVSSKKLKGQQRTATGSYEPTSFWLLPRTASEPVDDRCRRDSRQVEHMVAEVVGRFVEDSVVQSHRLPENLDIIEVIVDR